MTRVRTLRRVNAVGAERSRPTNGGARLAIRLAPTVAALCISVTLAACSQSGSEPVSLGVAERRFDAIVASRLGEELGLPPDPPFSLARESCDDLPWSDQDVDTLIESIGVSNASTLDDIATEAQLMELRTYLAGAVPYAVAVCPGSEDELIGLIGQMNRRGFGNVTADDGQVLAVFEIDRSDARGMRQIADDTAD